MQKLVRRVADGISGLLGSTHFYSPIVDVQEVAKSSSRVWPTNPKVLDIDFNDRGHEHLLTNIFPIYVPDFKYTRRPKQGAENNVYYTDNGQFGWLDAPTFYVLLRWLKPKRIIEVGSGFSSLLAANVNKEHLNGETQIACIEPYPREFLTKGVEGISRLIQEKVQDVPMREYDALESGDILFIDSSHVAKTGSDVTHLYFEVLPRLKSGVYIHIHDIFLPNDYPKNWVLREKRSWNEQYILRALLMNSDAYEVVFGCSYAHLRFSNLLKELFNGEAFAGGSFWIRKK